ncbi:probable low-specificity L-threonine aldolase 1 isoform X3 [Bombus pyrosoma]|uniref:probable low-specificity L-threonine aldolase 1 isoform X3 n=1 Tax=Bombus pyrosoma TaxID=396416 RepID=UPI001CB92CE2|nr:probable low-specificity L-threonine aldolase 1 isoform X3 [Bombus pyrosoma]
MYYDKGYSYATYEKDKVIVVDLRSDTLTKPTQKMREALSSAEVGDDVFHEDPTVKVLQETAAKMVGMEDALFVCSGTMANLIARSYGSKNWTVLIRFHVYLKYTRTRVVNISAF